MGLESHEILYAALFHELRILERDFICKEVSIAPTQRVNIIKRERNDWR